MVDAADSGLPTSSRAEFRPLNKGIPITRKYSGDAGRNLRNELATEGRTRGDSQSQTEMKNGHKRQRRSTTADIRAIPGRLEFRASKIVGKRGPCWAGILNCGARDLRLTDARVKRGLTASSQYSCATKQAGAHDAKNHGDVAISAAGQKWFARFAGYAHTGAAGAFAKSFLTSEPAAKRAGDQKPANKKLAAPKQESESQHQSVTGDILQSYAKSAGRKERTPEPARPNRRATFRRRPPSKPSAALSVSSLRTMRPRRRRRMRTEILWRGRGAREKQVGKLLRTAMEARAQRRRAEGEARPAVTKSLLAAAPREIDSPRRPSEIPEARRG